MKGKGLTRSLDRRGTRSAKKPPVAVKLAPRTQPTVCEGCGAVFARRTWRRDHTVTTALLARAAWDTCPACRQARRGEGFGRIVLGGAYVGAHADVIRRRIENVAARAAFTQPERRIVSIERNGAGLEIITTSQKLAHRVVHELKKAFGGRASYAWSDRDGSLFATWRREDVSRRRR
jgi:NMD protein affecting ribosome stability and mRNA decay